MVLTWRTVCPPYRRILARDLALGLGSSAPAPDLTGWGCWRRASTRRGHGRHRCSRPDPHPLAPADARYGVAGITPAKISGKSDFRPLIDLRGNRGPGLRGAASAVL